MAENKTIERLALLYSDGSMGISVPEETEDRLREDAIHSDKNETDPAHFTQVVRVRISIVEVIETPSSTVPAKQRHGACPACGHSRSKDAAHG